MKRDRGEADVQPTGDTSTLIAKFVSESGDVETADVSVPADIARADLDSVLIATIKDSASATYAFYVNNVEVTESLSATLLEIQKAKKVDEWLKSGRRFTKKDVAKLTLDSAALAEETVVIRYRPQAVFKVRPVSRCISSLHGHTEPVLVVAFNTDSSLLATGSGDKTVRIWDLYTETPQAVLRAHNDWVQVLSWSPCGTLLASGSKDGALCVWDAVLPHALVGRPPGTAHQKWVTCLAWRPWVVVGLGGKSIDAPRGGDVDDAPPDADDADAALREASTKGGVKKVGRHVGRGCRRFASGGKDGTVRVWMLAGGSVKFERTLTGHSQAVTAVRWGATGKIYTASEDRTIFVHDVDGTGASVRLGGHGHWINSLILNTDAVLRSGAYDHTVDASSMKDPYGEEARGLAEKRIVALLNSLAAATRAPMEAAERVCTASDDNTLFLWDPATSERPLARLVGHQGPVMAASYSPDGMLIASASADNSVRLWHGVSGRFMSAHRGHVAAVYAVAWSLDSRLFVSGGRDSTLKLWGTQQKEHVNDLPGHSDQVYALDWSPDGLRVASGSKDRTVRIWRH